MTFGKVLENVWKSSGRGRKSSENRQMRAVISMSAGIKQKDHYAFARRYEFLPLEH